MTENGRKPRPPIAHIFACMDIHEPGTAHHALYSAAIARSIAEIMGMDASFIRNLQQGALMHDIGKLAIDRRILLSPNPLTPDEFAQIRQHPAIGAELIQPYCLGDMVINIVYSHHEKWNGKGYPLGLKGDNIPLAALIMGIADAVEVMINGRDYKPSMCIEQIITELEVSAKRGDFNPDIVKLLLQYCYEIYNSIHLPYSLVPALLAKI